MFGNFVNLGVAIFTNICLNFKVITLGIKLMYLRSFHVFSSLSCPYFIYTGFQENEKQRVSFSHKRSYSEETRKRQITISKPKQI